MHIFWPSKLHAWQWNSSGFTGNCKVVFSPVLKVVDCDGCEVAVGGGIIEAIFVLVVVRRENEIGRLRV